MKIVKGYKTKQRSLILNYIAKNKDRHITAEDIMRHFYNKGENIGKSTVYRYLNVLLEKGIIRKYFVGKNSTACYRYVDQEGSRVQQYHLKCIQCDEVFDVECEALDLAVDSLWKTEKFKLDLKQTLLYGTCECCLKEKYNEKEETDYDKKHI